MIEQGLLWELPARFRVPRRRRVQRMGLDKAKLLIVRLLLPWLEEVMVRIINLILMLLLRLMMLWEELLILKLLWELLVMRLLLRVLL